MDKSIQFLLIFYASIKITVWKTLRCPFPLKADQVMQQIEFMLFVVCINVQRGKAA